MKHSLFRSIRHKLLHEGKLLRYLSYAVGEVVLIIVGILMALKINDWNEDKKGQVEFEEYIVQLKEDVQAVIDLANSRAESAEGRAREGMQILQVIEGEIEKSFNRDEFEQALGRLGKLAFVRIPLGNLNDLLEGRIDAISRDSALKKQVLVTINDVTHSLSVIEEKFRDLEIAKSVFIKYRSLGKDNGWEEFEGPPIKYDLNTLRTSEEFLYAIYNVVQYSITIRIMYLRIAEDLESFLVILEEYE